MSLVLTKGQKTVIVASAIVIFAGLYAYFRREFTKLKNACWFISGGVINSIGADKVNLTVFMKITNKSDLFMTIEKMDLNVYINNLFVSNFKKADRQRIEAHQSNIVQIDISFNPSDLLKAGVKNISTILTNPDKIVISVKGDLNVEMGLVKLNKFDVSTSMTLKEMMSPDPNKKC